MNNITVSNGNGFMIRTLYHNESEGKLLKKI